MSSTDTALDEARAALAAGDETRALSLLHDLFVRSDEPGVIEQVRQLAVHAHDASPVHVVEWKRLAVDAESREELAAR
jgi:hypothetical protein